MVSKVKIYYVYFAYRKTKNKNRVELCKENASDLFGVKIIFAGMYENGLRKRDQRKLIKLLKGYNLSDAVVVADETAADMLNISDMMFEARKYELIHNCRFIMDKMFERYQKTDSAAIVLDSEKWEVKNIFFLIDVIKDYYKKVDILTECMIPSLTKLAETAYAEWGVVINIYDSTNYPGEKKDFVLFLIKKWRPCFKKIIPFEAGFAVTDVGVYKEHNLYGSLIYKADVGLAYLLGTYMSWQKPLLCEKFHVSVIDIC